MLPNLLAVVSLHGVRHDAYLVPAVSLSLDYSYTLLPFTWHGSFIHPFIHSAVCLTTGQ